MQALALLQRFLSIDTANSPNSYLFLEINNPTHSLDLWEFVIAVNLRDPYAALFGLIVGITHWIIDFGKSNIMIDNRFPHTKGARNQYQKVGLYGINVDQALHLLVITLCVLFVH